MGDSGGGLMPFSSGKQWGYLDDKGNIAISPRFDDAYPFSEGLAAVESEAGDGFIDPVATC